MTWLNFGSMIDLLRTGAVLALMLGASAAAAQSGPAAGPPPAPESYADVADHAVESAVIIDARIRRIREIEPERAAGVPAHLIRLYIEADVQTVIYGRNPVASRIAYLTDQPRLANGRAPRLKRQRVLLFARPVSIANQVQLVVPSAQLAWTLERDSISRSIAAELARGNVPPPITGIAQAFHVPGTIAGESETQVFLRTGNGQPVSLTILRRPGQPPHWAAAFGEIVDESAGVPAPRTLAWYRLTCGLPPALPRTSITANNPSDIEAASADYLLARRQIGPCDRTPTVVAAAPPR